MNGVPACHPPPTVHRCGHGQLCIRWTKRTKLFLRDSAFSLLILEPELSGSGHRCPVLPPALGPLSCLSDLGMWWLPSGWALQASSFLLTSSTTEVGERGAPAIKDGKAWLHSCCGSRPSGPVSSSHEPENLSCFRLKHAPPETKKVPW